MSDNKSPLVSIIINCYNGELYLKETIDCVLHQTYKNWEIIFWDNMSSDNSSKIVKSYADKRIKYFKSSEHSRLGKARNEAIRYASGEWCAFLDCDDLWTVDKLQKQISMIKHNNIGLVYGGISVFSSRIKHNAIWSNRMIKSKNNLTNNLPEGEIFDKLLQYNFIPLVSAIFRRDLFNQIGGISEHMEIAEDYDLFVKLSYLTRVCAVQEVIGYYRVHEYNLSIGKQEQDFSETLEIVSRYLPLPSAIKALKIHHSFQSIQEVRDGKLFKGLFRFFSKGSFTSFVPFLLKKY